MMREMRRKKQQLSEEETIKILEQAASGVLSVLGDDDYPYGVPVSYVYHHDRIYIHCAKSGHKLDAIKKHNKASFCVIFQDDVKPEAYTTHYQSVIAFGSVHIMEDQTNMREAMELLALKYHPADNDKHRQHAIERDWKPLCMLEFLVEHVTGKEAIELVNQKHA